MNLNKNINIYNIIINKMNKDVRPPVKSPFDSPNKVDAKWQGSSKSSGVFSPRAAGSKVLIDSAPYVL